MQQGSLKNYFPSGKPALAAVPSYGPIYTIEQKTVAALHSFFTSDEPFDYHRPNAPDRETIEQIRHKLSYTAFKAAARDARSLIAESYAGIPRTQHYELLAKGLVLGSLGALDLGPAGDGWKTLGVPYPYFLGNTKLILSARLRMPFAHSESRLILTGVRNRVAIEFRSRFAPKAYI